MIRVAVEGMSCEHCVRNVREVLEGLDGIQSASVSLENNEAILEGEASDEAIRAVLEEEEYAVPAIVRSE